MLRRGSMGIALLAVLLLAACDGDLSEPLADRGEIADLLNGRSAASQLPAHTLPGLLHAAIRTVYQEQGAGAARLLVSDLRRAQEQLRGASMAGLEANGAAQLVARAEELGIVLRVFGDGIAATSIAAVRAEDARLREAAAAAALTTDARLRARPLFAALEDHLAEAEAALQRGDARGALDHAVQAGALAERVRRLLVDAQRIPALQELFDAAVARLRQDGNGENGRDTERLLARHDGLQRAAEDGVRSRDRQRAHAALEAARHEQIRVVLAVLGEAPVHELIEAIGKNLLEVDASLRAARAAGRDVSRLTRMSATARDMTLRARAALDTGDAVTALDLGSHAAGLVNSLRLGVPR